LSKRPVPRGSIVHLVESSSALSKRPVPCGSVVRLVESSSALSKRRPPCRIILRLIEASSASSMHPLSRRWAVATSLGHPHRRWVVRLSPGPPGRRLPHWVVNWPSVSSIGLLGRRSALHFLIGPLCCRQACGGVILFTVLSLGPLWIFGLSWVLGEVVSSGEEGGKGKSEPRQKIGTCFRDAPLRPPITWIPPLVPPSPSSSATGPHPSGEGRGTG